jgi:uncharacterized membrane protein YgcG
MIYIAHYHRLTWRLRRKNQLANLEDENDLPLQREENLASPADIAMAEKVEDSELSVLSAKQQERLDHHQTKFAKSHTFYKPHETTTHNAFPLRLLIAIVVLLDCHSLLQIALGTCTWAIYYKVRPFALTTVILCCSIACNITAGLLILHGDRRTRKKDVVERMFRQELTDEAIRKMDKRKERERRRNEELESFKRVEAEVEREKALYREEQQIGPQVEGGGYGESRSSLGGGSSGLRSPTSPPGAVAAEKRPVGL